MSTRVKNAVQSLKGALEDLNFPANPVVIDALKIIEDFMTLLCPKCDGQGKVRMWVAQDEHGPLEKCRHCKGTGREVKKILMPSRYCSCVEVRPVFGPHADPDCPCCKGPHADPDCPRCKGQGIVRGTE